MNIATLMIGCITKMITKVKVPDKVSMLGEDLHPRPLVAPITNHKLSRAFHHRNLEVTYIWELCRDLVKTQTVSRIATGNSHIDTQQQSNAMDNILQIFLPCADTTAALPPSLGCQTGSGRCHSSQTPGLSSIKKGSELERIIFGKICNTILGSTFNPTDYREVSKYLNPVVVRICHNDLLF